MLAYFFFIDGINTVTALGGVFGSTVLGITTVDLIITIVAIQFVAWPSAIAFTRFAGGLGKPKISHASLVGWIFCASPALSFHHWVH
ncbi:MAG: hypothetical protein CM15mP105_0690 [Methanobacteriota archaeon]|nr:MAG: hypothetical protein CM15mP105_0690 [Euryarchaeota archaeon]